MVRVYRVRFGLWLGPGVRPKVTVKFGVRARVIRVTWGLGLGYNEGQLRGRCPGDKMSQKSRYARSRRPLLLPVSHACLLDAGVPRSTRRYISPGSRTFRRSPLIV